MFFTCSLSSNCCLPCICHDFLFGHCTLFPQGWRCTIAWMFALCRVLEVLTYLDSTAILGWLACWGFTCLNTTPIEVAFFFCQKLIIKPNMIGHTCNTSMQKDKAKFLFQDKLWYIAKSCSKKSKSKKITKTKVEKESWVSSSLPMRNSLKSFTYHMM